MMIKDEEFFAWLDGELSPDEAARVEAEVAADPEKSRLAAEHRAMAAGLRRAFEGVAAQPVPDRLREAASAKEETHVIDFAAARSARETRKARPLWIEISSLAATLAVGIFAGSVLLGGMDGDGGGPVGTSGEQIVASSALKEALDVRLASMPEEDGPRIALTFRDRNGAICRTFEEGMASGMACRSGDEWEIRSLFQDAEARQGEFRMASGPSPQLMEAVEASIEGDVFDADQEREARERGWQD